MTTKILPYVLATVLLAPVAESAWSAWHAEPLAATEPKPMPEQRVELRGRRILLTNLEQAVTLSADDLTSFSVAQGMLSEEEGAKQRVVRLRLRVTNRAVYAQAAAPTKIVLGGGDMLAEQERLGRSLEQFSPDKDAVLGNADIASSATRNVSRYYLTPNAEVETATVELHDRQVVLTMPLGRLLSLTAQRRAQ